MVDYFFLLELFGLTNSILLFIYTIFSFKILNRSKSYLLRIVAFYLMFSFLFDTITNFFVYYVRYHFEVTDTLFLSILYRLGELLIIGYLVNKYWLKSKIIWCLISMSALFSTFELFTYRQNGIYNYTANAQIISNLVLLILLVTTLITTLQSKKLFNIRNQLIIMLFLGYFSIHLVYAVTSNFIINQSFSDQSFTLFFCSYILLHIVYYFALAFIVYKSYYSKIYKN